MIRLKSVTITLFILVLSAEAYSGIARIFWHPTDVRLRQIDNCQSHIFFLFCLSLDLLHLNAVKLGQNTDSCKLFYLEGDQI